MFGILKAMCVPKEITQQQTTDFDCFNKKDKL
jgi:hypothetical protein